jgi:hypothetical protein
MASDQTIRASDRDRDAVVDVLRDAYVAGRLTLEEFNERTAASYASRTWGDLRALTADLPVQPALGTDLPQDAVRPEPAQQGAQLAASPRQGAPRPVRRGRPGTVMPFVMFWILISLASRSPVVAAVPVVILALVMMISLLRRR